MHANIQYIHMYLVFEAGQGFLPVKKVLCILCAIDCCSVKCDVVFKLQTDISLKICRKDFSLNNNKKARAA